MFACVFFPLLLAAAQGAPPIPESLKIEHQHLHHALAAATKLPGETGKAATRVAELLHTHFTKEEEFALPPLGVLRSIASGNVSDEERRSAVALADRLKAGLPGMLADHTAIVAALDPLKRAATAERHAEVLAFIEQLSLHARFEEEVLYPAALLVGDHLRTRHP